MHFLAAVTIIIPHASIANENTSPYIEVCAKVRENEVDRENVITIALTSRNEIDLASPQNNFAAAGFDYEPNQVVKTLEVGSNIRHFCIEITLLNDNITEENETFALILTTSDTKNLVLQRNLTIITILDSDGWLVIPCCKLSLSFFAGLIASITETIFSVNEDDGAVEVCVSLSAELEATSLILSTRDSTGMHHRGNLVCILWFVLVCR